MEASDQRLTSLVEPQTIGSYSLVEQFCSVTGSTPDVAHQMLEACGNNLEMSINTFMEGNVAGAGSPTPRAPGTSNQQPLSDDEGVRQPIPQTSEQMIAESPAFGFKRKRYKNRSVFDGFRDFEAETRSQGKRRGKAKTLEDLFRPPIDITYKGTFAAARSHAVTQNLWLLVNVQDTEVFDCQILNRDVWSNQAVRNVLHEHFLLYQMYKESEEGEKYMQFYKVTTWPYIAIIDPRTGENMQTWNKLDALTFCDHATTFLTAHPSLDHSNTQVNEAPAQPELRNPILNATEEEQINAAISASLTRTTPPPTIPSCLTDTDTDQSDLETFTDSDDDNNFSPPPKKKSRTLDSSPASTSSQNSSPNSPNAKSKSPTCKSTRSKSPNKNYQDDVNNTSPAKRKSPIPKSPNSKNLNNKTQDTTKLNTKKSPNSKKSTNTKNGVIVNIDNVIMNGDVKTHEKSGDSKIGDGCGKEGWKAFLGKETDAKSKLMLRFPDGSREQLCIPCSSSVWAVVHYASEKGFPSDKYELVMTYPQRKISGTDRDLDLVAAKLHPQETIFVQSIG